MTELQSLDGARPATINHLIAVATILGGLVFFAINTSNNAEEIARSTQLFSAKGSDTYSRSESVKDYKTHKESHKLWQRAITADFEKQIAALPRPPADTAKLIVEMRDNIAELRSGFKFLESRLTQLEQAP